MAASEGTPAISLLIVVFNRSVPESAALSSVLRLPSELRGRVELFVRDNSALSRVDPAVLRGAGFHAVRLEHDGVNRPLGEIYRAFSAEAAGPVVLFFDDDTEVDARYVGEAVAALTGPDSSSLVCVPRIYDQEGRLFSPSRFRIFSGAHFSALEPGRYPQLNAIMSGVATTKVHLARLGPGAFSVRTALYGVDTMFMCAHAAADGATQVCAATLSHSLSKDSRSSLRESLRRSWLEAKGIAETVLAYRRRWVWLLPVYLAYFLGKRTLGALARTTRA